ncbi:cell envelope biogenesis protein OmpA [Flavobacterium akiainvivens]|uniref:Cell envelope biogenesis protein OmpA n=1 Tax=Flavobacterium akiainvivens TaxID=1202724 RepID=A0A0M9VGP4_9FLAO|nr:OmpA family protein [Flavobacterium akiainvivens]KOS04689.1 cell envelope biogenesis protein OmpA [Flavobacterium akiainvivens]SFQ64991.1 Outer membrane protein OmpA [Flavobacterium akiainvivens]
MKRLLSFGVLFLFPLLTAAQEQFSVYFDSNKSELTKKETDKLARWMVANHESKILAINGYTDEDGTSGYNDTLAQRRVDYVYAAVKNSVKTREDFKTHSFGELHKQSANKAENRKVTLYFLQKQDLHRENEILGIKEEAPKPVVTEKKDITYPEKVTVQGPGGREEELALDVSFMKQVAATPAGQKIVLPNMNFYENTFGIMPDSRPRLFELLEVMKANPGIKIKVQGHVCCMTADRKNLSRDRAKAIVMFLSTSGIERSRMTFEGFGVSQPLYPIPEKTPEEREANRRVEVLIVENPS